MKRSFLMLFVLLFVWGCENNKGQYRHDPNHHDKIFKLIDIDT